MKRTTAIVVAPLFCFLLNSSAAFAGNEELEARCQQWAKEDEIPSNEMADYLKSCVADLVGKQEAGEDIGATTASDQGKAD